MRTPILAVLALLAALLQAANPAHGATLRPMTTLASGIVRLSDLFDDAGPDAARALGPAPAPGARIVVEAPQLAAIARQFGVDWRPSSPGDRIVLDRPGQVLERAAMLAALRTALIALGAPDDADIDLPGFAAPLLPLGAKPELSVEQLDYQDGAGNFTAQMLVIAADMQPLRLRVAGTLQQMVSLPVPTHRLQPGSPLQQGDLRMARIRAGLAEGELLRDPATADGMVLRRTAMPGQPLLLADLERPEAVTKGARVAMQLLAPGLLLLAQGQALQGGPLGARIPVLNPASRAVVEAEITGPGQVRVAQGSTPITPPGGGGSYYGGYAARVANR